MIELKLQLSTACRLKIARLNNTSEWSVVIRFPLVEHRGAAQEAYWRCRAMNPRRRSSFHFFKTMLLWLLFTKLNWQWCSHWGWAHRRFNQTFDKYIIIIIESGDARGNMFSPLMMPQCVGCKDTCFLLHLSHFKETIRSKTFQGAHSEDELRKTTFPWNLWRSTWANRFSLFLFACKHAHRI